MLPPLLQTIQLEPPLLNRTSAYVEPAVTVAGAENVAVKNWAVVVGVSVVDAMALPLGTPLLVL